MQQEEIAIDLALVDVKEMATTLNLTINVGEHAGLDVQVSSTN